MVTNVQAVKPSIAESLKGVEKAAILLVMLGDQSSGEILRFCN